MLGFGGNTQTSGTCVGSGGTFEELGRGEGRDWNDISQHVA